MRGKSGFETRTWTLIVVVYAGWLASCWMYESLGFVAVVAGGWFIAWHNSLQHEAIHGHPTASDRVNGWLVGIPIGLWLPYSIYRDSHRAHHRSGALTDPREDPESFYVAADDWRRMSAERRALHWALQTLVGRLVLGPPWLVARLARSELRRLLAGDRSVLRVWLWHGLAMVPVVAWAVFVCRVPLWVYVLAFAYPGVSLSLLRSFAEHRPAKESAHRSVIVEGPRIFGWLFLHNNLHALHHAEPWLPWYELPARYRVLENELLQNNGGFRYGSYLEQLRRFAFRPKDPPVYRL